MKERKGQEWSATTVLPVLGVVAALLAALFVLWDHYRLNQAISKSTAALDSESWTRGSSFYVRRTNADTVIVFISSPFEDARSAWTNRSTGAYWPSLVSRDPSFKNTDVYIYSPTAPRVATGVTVDALVEDMHEKFEDDEVFSAHKRVVFLGHSVGGLLITTFLLQHRIQASKVPLAYLFSTPGYGSSFSDKLGTNPQLSQLLLSNINAYIQTNSLAWRTARIPTTIRCAQGTEALTVVPDNDPLCDGPIEMLRKDHVTIVQPADSMDPSYVAFTHAFLEEATKSPENTSVGGTETRRTWDFRFNVECNREFSENLHVPLEVGESEAVVSIVANIEDQDNIKAASVSLLSRGSKTAVVHVQALGLDRDFVGNCRAGGHGRVVVRYTVIRPHTFSDGN
jgi:hypothetical protein